MQAFLLGIALELLAGCLGTLGKQLVSFSARLSSRQRAKRLKFAGLFVTTLLGPAADASAYAFASQSLVAPLNGLDVVWNTITAPFTLGENLEMAHVAGALLVALGAGFTAVLGPHEQEHNFSSPEALSDIFLTWSFAGYVIAFCVGLVLSAHVLRRHKKGSGSKARAVALGATAGAIAGNMFFTTCALGIIRSSFETGNWTLWATPIPYALVAGALVVAIANIPFMARGLQEYEALFMVTLFEGSHIGVACISGQTVLGELHDMELWRSILYWLAVLMIFSGLFVIQRASVGTIVRRTSAVVVQGELPVSAAGVLDASGLSLGGSLGGSPLSAPASLSEGPVCWAGSISGIWAKGYRSCKARSFAAPAQGLLQSIDPNLPRAASTPATNVAALLLSEAAPSDGSNGTSGGASGCVSFMTKAPEISRSAVEQEVL